MINPLRNLKKYFVPILIFFVIFYMVGIIGINIPQTREWFIKSTPFALIISSLALIIFHEGSRIKRTLLVFSIIFIAGFFIEVVGVNTGLIFGEYQYGNTLSVKLFNTPILIGLNWLLMIYTTILIGKKISNKPFIISLLATALMLVYDFFLEPVAPQIDMWTWKGDAAPIQNFIAWGLIAFAFHNFVLFSKLEFKNRIAPAIFSIQLVFFIALNIKW